MTGHFAAGGVPVLLDFGSSPVLDRVLRQVHRIPPGGRLDCPAASWDHALALVDEGCVELGVASGGHLHLCRGAVFSLRGLTPAVLAATQPGSAVIITVRREPKEKHHEPRVRP